MTRLATGISLFIDYWYYIDHSQLVLAFTLRGVRGRGPPWRGRGFRRGWCRGCRRSPFRSCRCWWRWWKVRRVSAMLPCGWRWRPLVCAAGSCAWVFTIQSLCISAACLEVSTNAKTSPSASWTTCSYGSTRSRNLDLSLAGLKRGYNFDWAFFVLAVGYCLFPRSS